MAAIPTFRQASPRGLTRFGLAAVAAGSLGVIAAPLAASVLLTGLFGLPHVLYEMRYCDERFASRLPKRTLALIGGLLAAVAALRIGRSFGPLPGEWSMGLELGLGAGLAVAAISTMRRRRGVAALVAAMLIGGVILAPLPTFLAVAWLHNLTPLAFVAEATPAPIRLRRVAWLSLPFLAWPALIASGAPAALLRAAFGLDPGASPSMFGAGERPLSAFLPGGLALPDVASLFAAAVTAQAMHYFAVIVLLPRLLADGGGGGPTLAPWPPWRLFAVVVGALGVCSLGLNALNFGLARNLYGVAAALHSWIELPILLIALGQVRPSAGARSPRPTTPRWR